VTNGLYIDMLSTLPVPKGGAGMKAEERTGEKRLDEQMAELVSCGNTIKALTVLAERPASAKEIGPDLGLSTSAASHHVKKLVGLGMVELVETREAGSAFQHIYRAIVRPLVSNEEWQKLSVAARQRFSLWIVQLVLADAAASFAAGMFDAWPNNHLSRTSMRLDRQGFDEVAAIQDRALDEVLEAEARSSERMARGEETIDVVAAMMCFEVPQSRDRLEGVKRMDIQEVPTTFPAVAIRKSN
jgi:predicted transcriptional regulator